MLYYNIIEIMYQLKKNSDILKKNVFFNPGYYDVIKIIDADLFQIEGHILIKLKPPNENSKIKDDSFLKHINECKVKILPYGRNDMGEVISDVWLGGININENVFKK